MNTHSKELTQAINNIGKCRNKINSLSPEEQLIYRREYNNHQLRGMNADKREAWLLRMKIWRESHREHRNKTSRDKRMAQRLLSEQQGVISDGVKIEMKRLMKHQGESMRHNVDKRIRDTTECILKRESDRIRVLIDEMMQSEMKKYNTKI